MVAPRQRVGYVPAMAVVLLFAWTMLERKWFPEVEVCSIAGFGSNQVTFAVAAASNRCPDEYWEGMWLRVRLR
jgi:hypothetical protein